MRMIDADALNAKMYHDAFETDSDMQKWDSGCWIRYKMFEKNLEDTPTIEPPTTEWLGNHTPFRCKRCGHYTDSKTPYCAYCGRKAINYENRTD